MGGLHAAMTASLCPLPVGVASWIAPPSAIPAFTRGLLSLGCNWQSLDYPPDLATIDRVLANTNHMLPDDVDVQEYHQNHYLVELYIYIYMLFNVVTAFLKRRK
jgi:hypothetical protein